MITWLYSRRGTAIVKSGQTIYAVSAAGITVIKLPEPLDPIPAMQWPSDVHSGSDKSALHGPISQRMGALRSKHQK